ncbi:unnamed protein product [Protopolystoma xenopodis]|uniref:Uncharacterized protein n=1 Tax=Protopolystoma xenopodis TaxID=117903 RepID=A0A3S5AK71_9PLAT|nr:unnamed protein product [Protopolystoma xenopodis]
MRTRRFQKPSENLNWLQSSLPEAAFLLECCWCIRRHRAEIHTTLDGPGRPSLWNVEWLTDTLGRIAF